jgi:nucleosome binding factor SPN SPT16 subunit
MAEIKIDKNLFQERLSHFISAWKADKRSGDALFGGASSILILMGKTEETAQFQKNNAMHVWKLPYAMCSLADTDFMIVLVAWLRISGYVVPAHNGGTLRGDNCEEG